MLYGQVEGELRVSLEHVIEQRSTELSKVTRVQITLWGGVCVCVCMCVCVCVCVYWVCVECMDESKNNMHILLV